MGSIPGFSSLLDETEVTLQLQSAETRLENVLRPRDQVFRPDISNINWTIIVLGGGWVEETLSGQPQKPLTGSDFLPNEAVRH